MVGALEALGVQVEADWSAGRARVTGCSGQFPVDGAELFLGNAGTAMRSAEPLALTAGSSSTHCRVMRCRTQSHSACSCRVCPCSARMWATACPAPSKGSFSSPSALCAAV